MWMRYIGLFLLIMFVHFCFDSAIAFAYPTAKITVKAVDESGEPVFGADVSISFLVAKAGGWGTSQIDKNGKTDKEGLFVAESESSSMLGFSVDKVGYYQSGRGYEFKSKSLLNRWEPWNPTVEVVLKKKRNPVPMYVKYTDSIKMPALGEPVGYDFEKGDWVAPYGKGVISDFIFTFTSVDRAWTDYECSYVLTFSNEKDGIQEYFFDSANQSYFKWPFEAPKDGFLKTLTKEKSDTPKTGLKTNTKEKVNYIFRARTKTDKDGNIIEARYGKIENEINLWPGKVKFFYYFNPDGTRNLEHDDKRNLFEKSKWK